MHIQIDLLHHQGPADGRGPEDQSAWDTDKKSWQARNLIAVAITRDNFVLPNTPSTINSSHSLLIIANTLRHYLPYRTNSYMSTEKPVAASIHLPHVAQARSAKSALTLDLTGSPASSNQINKYLSGRLGF
jgi:hypothetical protein